jgi:hypothetical protein
MTPYLDSAVGEVVVEVRFLGLGEGLALALGVVRMARRCRRRTARVRAVGNKVTIGLIGGLAERAVVGGVRAVVDTRAGGALEDLEVVGVARGGVDQAESVGADVTELYNLLSVSVSHSLVHTSLKGNRVYNIVGCRGYGS